LAQHAAQAAVRQERAAQAAALLRADREELARIGARRELAVQAARLAIKQAQEREQAESAVVLARLAGLMDGLREAGWTVPQIAEMVEAPAPEVRRWLRHGAADTQGRAGGE
jgi:hypothetical protein